MDSSFWTGLQRHIKLVDSAASIFVPSKMGASLGKPHCDIPGSETCRSNPGYLGKVVKVLHSRRNDLEYSTGHHWVAGPRV